MNPSSPQPLDDQAAQALVRLCSGVLPVWSRHLATSRSQSEAAVIEMMQAFADIGPHIHKAERQSLQITQALSQSDSGVTGLAGACDQALTPLLQSGELSVGASAAIQRVLDMVHSAVRALEDIAKPFNHETHMVAEQVERMYVGFQYQDRISQMMALLESDIARLQRVVDGHETAIPEVQSWLVELESHYAMNEQRQVHSNSVEANASAGDSNETTFF